MGFVTEADQLTPSNSHELDCKCPALQGGCSRAHQGLWQKGLGTSPRTRARGSPSTGTTGPASVSPSPRWEVSTHPPPMQQASLLPGRGTYLIAYIMPGLSITTSRTDPRANPGSGSLTQFGGGSPLTPPTLLASKGRNWLPPYFLCLCLSEFAFNV